jgi:hypothetical protein
LTRVSINLQKASGNRRIAGHRRAEATPSFGRLCPAMAIVEYPRYSGFSGPS